jgi:2,4-dienoyl-CoA reductase-like NADH-dependent reductase (Old Yellow Enzyme family)/NADPH-dependent 2,4-dienoyl-CoA reductase/sulfur reductase-like enzyme
MSEKFPALSQRLRLGDVWAKNRIWQAPMETNTCSINGEVTDLVIAHYEARARGGVGLITQEFTAVDGRTTVLPLQLRIDKDEYMVGLSRLVEAVHAYGTPIILQLHHAGMFSDNPVSPSGVACFDLGKGHHIQPKVLTVEEVEEIRDMFIAAAVRAKTIGYDGVELHGATAYLLAQFFSPHNNKRVDKYGGGLPGRMQLALEIVRGIRAQCGPDYVLGYTMVDTDLLPDGVTREEALQFAKTLEAAGVTYIDLQSSGTYETFHLECCPAGLPRQPKGMFEIIKLYKQAVNIPVTCRACGEYDPAVWNDAIDRGCADAVRVAKQHLAEPELAGKVLSGHAEDVRPCVKCLNCLEGAVVKHMAMSCTVNPGGARGEAPYVRALSPKKVMVIGGGPGGLEAARVAALRGHSVTLVEKSDHLGGNLYIASLPIGKEDFNKFTEWEERQCRKLGVDIRFKTEGTPALVRDLKPDAVIVATGSTPIVPPFKGIDQPFVVSAEDVLQGKTNVGRKVLVAGGGEVGLETADYLLNKGLADEVTVVEMRPEMGMDMGGLGKLSLFVNQFPKYLPHRLKLLTNTFIDSITQHGLLVRDRNYHNFELKADTVVMALGYTTNARLRDQLSGIAPETHVIGDAMRPRRIINAIHEANICARAI